MIDPLSFDAKLNQALLDMQQSAGLLNMYRMGKESFLQQLAGTDLWEMRDYRDRVIAYLQDPVADLRIAAPLILKDYWRPSEEYSQVCSRMAFADLETRVRGVALNCLYYCAGKVDSQTEEFLRTVVRHQTRQDPTFAAILGKVDRKLAKCSEIRATFANKQRNRWRLAAGPHFEGMMQSRQASEQFLEHPDVNLRLVALDVLQGYWGSDARLAQSCEKMAFQDPDPEVRQIALIRLSSCYKATNNSRIGQLLAQVVHDGKLDASFRTQAYCGLFQVRGLPPLLWPSAAIVSGDFQFPQDIDWRFVDSFAIASE